ncbi:MAG TPA: 50S ribosomal protein L29 [Flavobacteriales bacterium]|jgi:large subunit ribosomal protein L29|nr:50S ribosomal protein L29 [Flavobacteriales bacterium]HIK67235.1 50S ribosomal protein L29 [Flavobacteriales bacterium]
MIEMNEIHQMSDKDLVERIDVEREALSKLRFNHTIAGLETPTILKIQKRDVARLLTEQTARNKAS